ncbi:MAG: hypothetical protein IJ381_08870 [Clostridia bacterium]|nr:hypothetical protein [Clostridia bacterium]
MLKRTSLFAFILLFIFAHSSFAASLGPVSSFEELQSAIAASHDQDIILISGDIHCADSLPLSTAFPVQIASQPGNRSMLRGLRLNDANISFSDIDLSDSLEISGTSYIHLLSGVVVTGSDHRNGISFHGDGMLIVDKGVSVTGGNERAGISLTHAGSEFYASLEGRIFGGSGYEGGPGVVISPLSGSGTIMVSGTIYGGTGDAIGGNALNLYALSSNAFITVSGNLHGGSGSIGGDGIQLVSASDRVNVGISGIVKGGAGKAYGGDAVMLMNAAGGSSIHLSGSFSGGDALNSDAIPGTALQLVGDMTALRTRVENCLLEDGRSILPVQPDITPLPEIESSINTLDSYDFAE